MLFPTDTEKYSSKYHCIPDDVLKEVQFLTEHGNLAITTQRKLLKAKFPTLSILDCDLTNAIQKYKVITIIIKHELTLNSTLCNLANTLDTQLEMNKLLSEYLTLYILSAVHFEIAQCLYFIASKVESNIIEDPGINIKNGCIEDKYDAKQTLLQSMIAEVGEERVCEL
ncbi:hypothetical protein C1646_764313 [Rhizophagus diaphanus]|nr:hypothetical protein C1646_764313 [Rhizophagus diaphanus] [Rhizophagus sp. MUCL 43196]